MRILEERKEGIKIKIETLDDLWYLKILLKEGDKVAGKTFRRIRSENTVRADKGERIPVFIEIDVEKVKFSEYKNSLRITGKIRYASDESVPLGSYHTIEVRVGDSIFISKEFSDQEIEILKEALKHSKKAEVLILCIEDDEAEFSVVRKRGVDNIARISYAVSGKKNIKEHDASKKEFFSQVLNKLKELVEREEVEKVIIAGIGFFKEDFYEFLKEKERKLAEMCSIVDVSSSARACIQEVLRRGVIEKICEESRISTEARLVEEVLKEIAKDGKATYGLSSVKEALSYSAVDTLLVTDNALKKIEEVEEIMKLARDTGAKTYIISTEHEAGEKLDSIGGVAALLRFKV